MNILVENDNLQTEYRRSSELYSSAPVELLGRLTLAQADVKALPVNLDDVYSLSIEQLRSNPRKAMSWARTYGQLSVGLALDGQTTSFSLDRTADFKPPKFAEIETERKNPITASLKSSDRDSEVTYLLADNGPERTELSLIKALHMLDFAIVKKVIDLESDEVKLPLVLATSPDELEKLLYDFNVRLRMYGNVRSASDAPKILGTVLPTQILEESGISTYRLSGLDLRNSGIPKVDSGREKIDATAIGITTAKKPHLGHAFLLTKAVGQAGSGGRVVVELNDQGPRIAAAVDSLAVAKNISFALAAQQIDMGDVAFEAVEDAYKVRSGVNPGKLPRRFSLKNNNGYYRDLLSGISPQGCEIDSIANSELYQSMALDAVDLPYASRVFKGSGMTILSNETNSQAAVIEKGGRLTAAGIIGALCTAYNITFIDSPRPLDQTAQSVFQENGLQIEQIAGVGVSINFNVASGTAGNSLSFEAMLEMLAANNVVEQNFLAVCRLMLNRAFYIEGDGGSLNPNYASVEAASDAFQIAISEFVENSEAGNCLYEPLNLKRATSLIYKDLIRSACGEIAGQGKAKVGEIRQILAGLPGIGFSDELAEYVLDPQILDDESVGKKFLKQEPNSQLMQALRTGQAKVIIPYLEKLATTSPDVFAEVIAGSIFENMMQTMGYSLDQASYFCSQVKELRDVYQIAR